MGADSRSSIRAPRALAQAATAPGPHAPGSATVLFLSSRTVSTAPPCAIMYRGRVFRACRRPHGKPYSDERRIKMKVSRRNFLKSVGMGAAVAGVSGFSHGNPLAEPPSGPPNKKCDPQGSNKLFDQLKPCCPGESLAADEMRITFLGTSPIRTAHAASGQRLRRSGPDGRQRRAAGLRHVRLWHGRALQLRGHVDPVPPDGQDLPRPFACGSHGRAFVDLLFRRG